MNGNMLEYASALFVALAASASVAADALVRVNLADGGAHTERVLLETVSSTQVRFTYPKERIADDVVSIDVVPDFMTARKGDEGYWIDARGAYGRFDKECGSYANDRAGWEGGQGSRRKGVRRQSTDHG